MPTKTSLVSFDRMRPHLFGRCRTWRFSHSLLWCCGEPCAKARLELSMSGENVGPGVSGAEAARRPTVDYFT